MNNSSLRQTNNRQAQNTVVNNGKQKQNHVDWNLNFLRNPTETTIFQFEQVAVSALMELWEKDSKSPSQRRIYDSQGLKIIVSDCFTQEAAYLKRQFRNYHFIIQACKNKVVVGVPLCTLIEWQGIVALVKAAIPAEAEEVRLAKVNSEVRELERYTRISNSVLEKCILWDLTNVYGLNN